MADEDKLATLFAALDAQDQQTLLAFAEFLRARAPLRPATPTSIPRAGADSAAGGGIGGCGHQTLIAQLSHVGQT